MDHRWVARCVVLGVVVALALVVRSYFSPANVVKRSLRAAIESFEQEQLIGAMHPVSRGYDDRWGMSYEGVAGPLRSLMDGFDAIEVDLEPPDVTVEGDEALVRMVFVVSGSDGASRGYVLGSRAEPCTASQRWRKEPQGWRIVTTEELDIPELRDELAELESQ
jgi:hypothetical protein